MNAGDVKKTVGRALEKVSLAMGEMPRLLSDNGPCYISGELKEFIREREKVHIGGKPTETSSNTAQDRALPSLDKEHHQTGQSDPSDRIFWKGQENNGKRKLIKKRTMLKRRKKHQIQKL